MPGIVEDPSTIKKGKYYEAGNQSWVIRGSDEKGYDLYNLIPGEAEEIADSYRNLLNAQIGLMKEIDGFNQDKPFPIMIFTDEMKKNILTEGVPIAQVEEQQEKNTALV